MQEKPKTFYVLQIEAAKNEGLALVVARTPLEAKQCLQRQGQYNGVPNAYVVKHVDEFGQYCGPEFGLQYESYISAMAAYAAINNLVKKLALQQAVLISKTNYDSLEERGLVDPTIIYFVYDEEDL